MRDKTRKRLRKCTYPFAWLWVLIAMIIGYGGACLLALAYIIIGETTQAKKVITERV